MERVEEGTLWEMMKKILHIHQHAIWSQLSTLAFLTELSQGPNRLTN